jgi:hypothetical protein
VIALWTWLASWAVACPESPPDALRAALADGDVAASQDLPVDEAWSRALEAASCARAPLTSGDAALLHRLAGLVSTSHGDRSAAVAAFAVSRALGGPAPTAGRALRWWDDAPVADGVAEVRDGGWWVDGQGAAGLPDRRPTLVQRRELDGSWVTVWLAPDDPLPLALRCARLEPRSSVTTAADRAREALAALDKDTLIGAAEAARRAVPCVVDPLSTLEVGAVLRFSGVASWISSPANRASAEPWFRAAQGAEPGYVFPEPVLDRGHPLALALADADPAADPRAPLGPARGELRIDGRPAMDAPRTRPFVLQHVEHGRATVSALVLPGDPLPSWPPPLDAPTVSHSRSPRRLPIQLASGGALVVGAALWTGATVSYGRYCEGGQCPPGFFEDEIRPQRAAGGVLMGVGAGALTATWAIR